MKLVFDILAAGFAALDPRLPGSLDPERLQLFGFAFIQMVLYYAIYAASARTAPQARTQLVQILRRARGDHFHVAIFGIAHPTTQFQLAGFAVDKPSEPYSLHPSLNQKM
jgi:hypothetical protein